MYLLYAYLVGASSFADVVYEKGKNLNYVFGLFYAKNYERVIKQK